MKTSTISAQILFLAALSSISACGLSTNSNGGFSLNAPATSGAGAGSSASAAYRVQRPRSVATFHGVSTDAVVNLVITAGQPANVVVEAEEAVLPEIGTDVKDGILIISLDREKSNNLKSPVRVLISTPKLDKLTMNGVGQSTITGLAEPFVTIKQSGAGSLTASGMADMVDLTMSGVGSANLKDLRAKSVTALLSGTGSAKVSASESITATVSGIGKLTYSGNPPKVQKTVSGLGSIGPE